jgi:hypothetical protein
MLSPAVQAGKENFAANEGGVSRRSTKESAGGAGSARAAGAVDRGAGGINARKWACGCWENTQPAVVNAAITSEQEKIVFIRTSIKSSKR